MMPDVDFADGTPLDILVLDAMGLEVITDGSAGAGMLGTKAALAIVGDPTISPFVRSPSREWEVGGPLIEQNRIATRFEKGLWIAECRGHQAKGHTVLVAAMRAFCKAATAERPEVPGGGEFMTLAQRLARLGNVVTHPDDVSDASD